jgi:hypothetical protein
MGRGKAAYTVISASFAAFLYLEIAHASAIVFHIPASETRLELFTVPLSQAPIERLGAQIPLFQLHLNEFPTEAVFVIIPENQFWARILLERMQLRLVSTPPNESLYGPSPEQLPLQIEQLSLVF